MKYYNHSEAYNGIKTFSQLHFFTYESINTCEYVKTSCQFLNFSAGAPILSSVYCDYSQVMQL